MKAEFKFTIRIFFVAGVGLGILAGTRDWSTWVYVGSFLVFVVATFALGFWDISQEERKKDA